MPTCYGPWKQCYVCPMFGTAFGRAISFKGYCVFFSVHIILTLVQFLASVDLNVNIVFLITTHMQLKVQQERAASWSILYLSTAQSQVKIFYYEVNMNIFFQFHKKVLQLTLHFIIIGIEFSSGHKVCHPSEASESIQLSLGHYGSGAFLKFSHIKEKLTKGRKIFLIIVSRTFLSSA